MEGNKMNKQIMSTVGLDDFVQAVEEGLCPFCKKQIKLEEFRDPISLREFEISGICQACQDETFGTNQ